MDVKHNDETLRIEIFTKYDSNKSDPGEDRYVFLYTIGITNLCNEDIQLMRRKWIVTDGNNESHEVEGEGVVGEKPVIEPNNSFAYTSGIMLDTEIGTMEGEYTVRNSDGVEFNVPIKKFTLSIPRIIN